MATMSWVCRPCHSTLTLFHHLLDPNCPMAEAKSPFALEKVVFNLPYTQWQSHDAQTKLEDAKKEVARDPSRAGSASADFPLLWVAAEAAREDERLRTAAMAEAFINAIIRAGREPTLLEYTLTPDAHLPRPREWEAPLLGILNLLEPIADVEEFSQNAEIVEAISSRYLDVARTLWQDLAFLLHPGCVGDHRRCLVARTILSIARIPEKRSTMYDPKTISLVMHCWIHTTPDPKYRLSASACARCLFFQTQEIPPPPSGALTFALQCVSVDTFIARETEALQHPAMIGGALSMELKALDPFTANKQSFAQLFTDAKLYVHVIDAVHRECAQLEEKLSYGNDTLLVFFESDRLMKNILSRQMKARPASYLLRDIISHPRIMKVATVGLHLGSLNPGVKDMWIEFIKTLVLTSTPTIPPQRGWLFFPVEKFRDEARKSIRRFYYYTESQLWQPDSLDQRCRDLWAEVGRVFRISQENAQAAYRHQKQCCSILCPQVIGRDKMQKCRRCKLTYYCSATCQSVDWVLHRKECREERLIGAAAVPYVEEDDVMPPVNFIFPAES
ncbi:unnamed protein product [Cyclocybe aegerita]|uniref:MYND-type domain-containing protein n=1 Tax=Cyclocybe aegerita TaxID=1973307 RepID=A0A8S0XY54_CYCAE|nr:unnamed protein product [Cyclocybe aegerita]